MSDDKKAIGKSSGPKQTGIEGSDGGQEKAAMNDAPSGKNPVKTGTARNQDILPGILGKQLKAAYGELLNSPVPDAITKLIKQLKDNEQSAAPQAKPPGSEESGR